ncbi:hypothetical protein RU97_GL001887 [Enterococcus canis]|uniref:Uncharacterized protein n=1 Tax=Enterococcus canis TaxID=214095 RepID=A0A1L8RFD3_9ENTE|nr:hypothetical protein RU97_GL001887 [Enterococcus canis]
MDPEKEKELGKRLYVLIRKIAPLPFLFFLVLFFYLMLR